MSTTLEIGSKVLVARADTRALRLGAGRTGGIGGLRGMPCSDFLRGVQRCEVDIELVLCRSLCWRTALCCTTLTGL